MYSRRVRILSPTSRYSPTKASLWKNPSERRRNPHGGRSMNVRFVESEAEDAALIWLQELGYSYTHGSEIAPGEPGAERENYQQVILLGRLRDAVNKLNRHIPAEALD